MTDQILIDRTESRIHQLEEESDESGPGEKSAVRAFDDAVDDWNALIGDVLQGYPVTDTVKERVRAMVCTSLRVATWSPASGLHSCSRPSPTTW